MKREGVGLARGKEKYKFVTFSTGESERKTAGNTLY